MIVDVEIAYKVGFRHEFINLKCQIIAFTPKRLSRLTSKVDQKRRLITFGLQLSVELDFQCGRQQKVRFYVWLVKTFFLVRNKSWIKRKTRLVFGTLIFISRKWIFRTCVINAKMTSVNVNESVREFCLIFSSGFPTITASTAWNWAKDDMEFEGGIWWNETWNTDRIIRQIRPDR